MNIVGSNDMVIVDKIISKDIYSIIFKLRSGIKLISSRFKLISINYSRRGQAEKLVMEENTRTDMTNIPGYMDNGLHLKNDVEYVWARFI